MSYRTLRNLVVLLMACLACYANAAWLRPVRDLAHSLHWIESSYVEPKSTSTLRDAAMKGMLESLDPYSAYIPESSFSRFNAVFEQQFAGLGIQIEGPPQRPNPTIVATLFNSPAFRVGLRPGDVLLKIDERSLKSDAPHSTSSKPPIENPQKQVEQQYDMDQISQWLKGPVGSNVSLIVDRSGERLDFHVPREFVSVESVTGDRRNPDGSWDYRLQSAPQIAYVHIELFGERTASELSDILKDLPENCQGLVIDLRDNSGGLLEAAIEICDLFLDDGPIVSTIGRQKESDKEVVQATPGVIVPDQLPLCVLINRESASASEVVAACLKDRQRATIVGERSYGKGNVQSIVPVIGGRAAIRLTTAYYYPPSGRRIHRRPKDSPTEEWGVLPDPVGLVESNEQDDLAVRTRLRLRSDPLRNGLLADHPLAQVEDPDDHQISNDKPLMRAIALLRSTHATP